MCAMHARKTARDAYFPTRVDDVFFTPRGDIAFKDTGDARRFADRVNMRDERKGPDTLRPAELASLRLQPPADWNGTVSLTLSATVRDATSPQPRSSPSVSVSPR